MGSHQDIWYALEAFTAHCDRHPLDRRPTYWVQYFDIWGDPQGELGIADPITVDDVRHTPDATVFAILTPWAVIPSMAEAWLVVDRIGDGYWVVQVRATPSGYLSPVWQVPYTFEDDGSITPGWPQPLAMPPVIGAGVAAATKARQQRKLWEGDYDFETIMPVVKGMLNP